MGSFPCQEDKRAAPAFAGAADAYFISPHTRSVYPEGKPRYCALRAPGSERKFRQDVENSDKTYGFCMEGRSDRVYEFEAPIDAMSHATLC